jgi:hypothetical protein
MGGQFYLFWHAAYFDDEVVADGARLKVILDETQDFCGEMEPGDERRALNAPLEPVVELGEEEVQVSVVIFSKWGGLARRTFFFTRQFPHEVLQVEDEVLVEYQCNVAF